MALVSKSFGHLGGFTEGFHKRRAKRRDRRRQATGILGDIAQLLACVLAGLPGALAKLSHQVAGVFKGCPENQ